MYIVYCGICFNTPIQNEFEFLIHIVMFSELVHVLKTTCTCSCTFVHVHVHVC